MNPGPENTGHASSNYLLLVLQNAEARCVACLFKLPNDVAQIPGDTLFKSNFKPNHGLAHTVTADNLQKSIQRGCHVCAYIGRLCTFTDPRHQSSYFQWLPDILRFCGHNEYGELEVLWSREIFLAYKNDSSNVDRNFHPFARARLSVGTNTGSAETMERIKEWSNDCSTNHSCCLHGGIVVTALPREIRILEIMDHKSARVRLVDGTSNAKFAALSYRWGPKTKAASLTRGKLDKFRQEVPQSSLYKLFRDVITVAGELGLKYIWIDCLCIIQVRGLLLQSCLPVPQSPTNPCF
ncbi:uncharacterized protein F4822DRAFT_445005 [Hypoxylon trugodes]|uniref:uncharacterized protein n=1 Tax=Hypoxylon trugodes TaxID=326681 RepID=UPI00219129A6|nr:uncharacterized protein F4822DRAFT_445005 [Hypoxylon trugodes]KAI1386720.1 hypothetical protein F4822DRAFT_445005 [Hypoxylon trugodes]